MKHIENVVIGELLVHPSTLFALDENDWEQNEKEKTLFTNERSLPKLMVECGMAPSVSEIRRNKPEFIKTLDQVDFIEVKWGKKKLFIGVGK